MATQIRFSDDLAAAEALLEVLPASEIEDGDFVIVAASVGAVVMADFLASRLGVSYELLLREKIYAPNNAECVIAVVSETEEIVADERLIDSFGITLDFVYGEAKRKYEEKILKNLYRYRKGKLLTDLAGRNVLLMDDAAGTGGVAMVGIKTLWELGARSVFYAAPVIASDLAPQLLAVCDRLFCVKEVAGFVEAGFYYENRLAPSSEQILEILEESAHYLPLQKEK